MLLYGIFGIVCVYCRLEVEGLGCEDPKVLLMVAC